MTTSSAKIKVLDIRRRRTFKHGTVLCRFTMEWKVEGEKLQGVILKQPDKANVSSPTYQKMLKTSFEARKIGRTVEVDVSVQGDVSSLPLSPFLLTH